MRRTRDIRFRPPRRALDSAERWLLSRAFGPPASSPDSPPDPLAITELATRLDLAGRIATRVARDELERDLGLEGAEALRARRHRSAAYAIRYDAVAERLLEATASVPGPFVLLKGYALHHGGWLAPGARTFTDLDVLVPARCGEAVLGACRAAGYGVADGPANEHHLPVLHDPTEGSLDVHFVLPGLGEHRAAWWGVETLVERGLLGESSLGGSVRLPAERVLAAHAIAHTIDQHGLSPQPQSHLRLLGDLAAVLPDEAAWDEAQEDLASWLRYSVVSAEIAALRRLCRRLASGDLEGLQQSDASTEAALLHHFLAAALDLAYRESLRLRYTRRRLAQATARGQLLRYIRRKLRDLAGHLPPRRT